MTMPRKAKEAPPKTQFAARLVRVRESYGMATGRPDLDKKSFAKLLNLEAQTYRRYEIGDTEPNIAVLRKIRELTNVSLDTLICGEGRILQQEPSARPVGNRPVLAHRKA